MDKPSKHRNSSEEKMNKYLIYIMAIVAVTGLVVGSYGFVLFQGQIADLESSNSELQSTLNDLQGTLTTVEGQLDTIEGQIEEYQETIEQQQAQINESMTVTLVDSMGNVVTLTEPPERIVSLAPSNTEILFAIGAGDRVVGVTKYCNYPYNFTAWIEEGNLTSVGGYSDISSEPIVALEPDLILATSRSIDAATNLINLGYNVLVIEGHTIEDIFQDILLVGRATYKNAEASALVKEMSARIDAVATQLADATTTPKVYYELWYDPYMTAGPDTFIDEVITLAGGENIFNDATESWPSVSSETIIAKNPDVIIFGDSYMSGSVSATKDSISSRSGWNVISAVQNDALYSISDDIINRNGPRVVDAIEAIAQMCHPDIFGEP